MGKGGGRLKSGRPLGAVAAKYQITAAQIGHGDYMPVEYMLALMRDESAEPQRRDAMAVQAAPFCHPKLNAVATTNASSNGHNGDINLVQIFAVPRGASVGKDGVVTIEGNADLSPIEPLEGTPALRSKELDHAETRAQVALSTVVRPSEPLPVFDVDTVNVTRLDTYRRDDE